MEKNSSKFKYFTCAGSILRISERSPFAEILDKESFTWRPTKLRASEVFGNEISEISKKDLEILEGFQENPELLPF